MKRLLALITSFLLLCLGLSACSCSSNAGTRFAGFVAERQKAISAAPPELDDAEPIKIETYEDANFAKSLGFDITAYPNNSTLFPQRYYVLDDWFAQIEFATNDGKGYVLRAAFTDKGFLTTTYTEAHTAFDELREIGGKQVHIRNSKKGCSMITWAQGDFQLLLHSNSLQGQPPDAIIEAFVSQTVCTAA